jgi:hypothetical protein
MRRFAFRLEQIRSWRRNQYDLEQVRLQGLYAELRSLEAAQQRITSEFERSRRALVHASVLVAVDLHSLEHAREYTRRELRRLWLAKTDLDKRIAAQRSRVLDARRQSQLLEIMRDKALVAWTAARDKEEEELGAELFLARRDRR